MKKWHNFVKTLLEACDDLKYLDGYWVIFSSPFSLFVWLKITRLVSVSPETKNGKYFSGKHCAFIHTSQHIYIYISHFNYFLLCIICIKNYKCHYTIKHNMFTEASTTVYLLGALVGVFVIVCISQLVYIVIWKVYHSKRKGALFYQNNIR